MLSLFESCQSYHNFEIIIPKFGDIISKVRVIFVGSNESLETSIMSALVIKVVDIYCCLIYWFIEVNIKKIIAVNLEAL